MPADSPDRPDPRTQPRSTAIEHLEALGLSTYAARTFVALVSLGEGTARDVSHVADVPRTRVYDAVEELRSHGLVDVQQTTPKRFWAISPETTGRQFEQEYTARVNALTAALDALDSTARADEQRGVWTVTGRTAVAERVAEFIETADDELVYMTVDALLTEPITDRLLTASERGVAIKLGRMEPTVATDIREAVPEAELFESLWDWTDAPAGRVLMVDQEKTLVSVLVPDDSAAGGDGTSLPSDPRDETAIWGTGTTNSLVVVVKALFAWHLDDTRG